MENLIKRLKEVKELLLEKGCTKNSYHINTINLAIYNLEE